MYTCIYYIQLRQYSCNNRKAILSNATVAHISSLIYAILPCSRKCDCALSLMLLLCTICHLPRSVQPGHKKQPMWYTVPRIYNSFYAQLIQLIMRPFLSMETSCLRLPLNRSSCTSICKEQLQHNGLPCRHLSFIIIILSVTKYPFILLKCQVSYKNNTFNRTFCTRLSQCRLYIFRLLFNHFKKSFSYF